VRGESSFLDWREQTTLVDAARGHLPEQNLAQRRALSGQRGAGLMADKLGHADVATKHRAAAARIQQGINQHLWLERAATTGQFMYGRTF
jgi:hypothetical protein